MPERACSLGKIVQRCTDSPRKPHPSLPPSHGYLQGAPHLVVNISLTHNSACPILPLQKRKFLSSVQPWLESLSFRLGVIAYQLDADRIPEPFRTYLMEGRTPEVEAAQKAAGIPRSKTSKRVMAYDRATCISWAEGEPAQGNDRVPRRRSRRRVLGKN